MANTKITTGADATIVAAATRAGLAAAPPDYSGNFENVSKVYGETVKSSAEAFKSIANATALIGGELVRNAAEWNSAVQKVYDAQGTENVVRETRKKRMEILTRKNKLFSEIDQWGEALDNATVAVESNNLDYSLMGLEKQEMLNAVIASNTNNKITVAGHYARVTTSDNGSLSYTVYNKDGSEATYSDGSTRTISLRDFQSLLTENVADKENVYGGAMNELSTSAENLGATYGGKYTDYHSGKMRGALNNMTNTANDRRRLMRTPFGIDNKSFYDDITNGPSELQADMWTLMMEDLTAGEKEGELAVTTGQRGELLANIEDTDGSKGISKKEIENQWMAFTGSLLSGESDFSKQAIIDYADKKLKTNFEFGSKQKAIGQNAGKEQTDSDTDVSAKSLGWGIEYPSTGGVGQGTKKVAYSTLETRRNDLLNFEGFSGEYFDYQYDGKNWFAYDGGEKVNNIEGGPAGKIDISKGISIKNIAKIEGLKKPTENYSVFDEKIAKDNKIEKDEGGTGLGVSKNMLSNKENIEQELTKAYGENFLKKYYLVGGMDTKKPRFGGLFGSTVITNNTVEVRDKETNKVVYTFETGDSATVKEAEDMNKFFSEDFLSLIPGEEI